LSLNDESRRLEGVVNTSQWQRPVVNVQASIMLDGYSQLVTRSTYHQSTHHTCVSSHRQIVTSEHITKPPVVIC